MSTLMLLALIVAGVAVAYLLETWSEGGTSELNLGGWFSSYPLGYFKSYYPGDRLSKNMYEISLLFVVSTTFFTSVFLMTNFPKVTGFATVYAFMSAAAVTGMAVNALNPKRSPLIASASSKGRWGIGGDFIIGVVMALAFFPILKMTGTVWPSLAVKGAPMMQIALVGVLAPVGEQAFIGNVYATTVTENLGPAFGVLLTALSFGLMHALAYQMSLVSMGIATLFMAVSTMALIKTKSWMPGLWAHIMLNMMVVGAGLA